MDTIIMESIKVDVAHDLDDNTAPVGYTLMNITNDKEQNLIPA